MFTELGKYSSFWSFALTCYFYIVPLPPYVISVRKPKVKRRNLRRRSQAPPPAATFTDLGGVWSRAESRLSNTITTSAGTRTVPEHITLIVFLRHTFLPVVQFLWERWHAGGGRVFFHLWLLFLKSIKILLNLSSENEARQRILVATTAWQQQSLLPKFVFHTQQYIAKKQNRNITSFQKAQKCKSTCIFFLTMK